MAGTASVTVNASSACMGDRRQRALGAARSTRESIDESRLRRHVDWLIEAQVDGLLVGGTCGEFSALEISERERLAELSIDCAADRVPVCIE
jgi:dihydrodipicolinate synthase/N-acetylneuraminate lyase